MKKSLKGILASVVAMLVFAPSVKAEVIELTQADFIEADIPSKNIGYDYMEGEYNLPVGEYKITENITLPESDSSIYFHDGNVVIDATGYTVKASFTFVDSDVTIVGGTFEGEGKRAAMNFHDSNALIKNGTFKGNQVSAIYFNNLLSGGELYVEDTPLYTKDLTIEKGIFTSSFEPALTTFGGKQITIQDGTFTGSYAGINISSYEKATIEKGTFKAAFEALNEVEDAYDYKGAIVISDTTDTSKIGALLSENSTWADDVEVNDYNRHFVEQYGEFDEKAVYTQKEISVITKEEKAAIDAKKAAEETKNAKKTYKVLDGEKQEYNLKSSDRLTFRFDIDYAEFVASGKVYVDDVLIDSSNYETKEGSTILVFTKDYTDHLKVGNHTIKVVTDKGEATAEFTIKKSEKNPGTGDNAIKYIVFTILAVAAAVVVTVKRKKIFNY